MLGDHEQIQGNCFEALFRQTAVPKISRKKRFNLPLTVAGKVPDPVDVRKMENVIRRALTIYRNDWILPEDLSAPMTRE